MAKVMVGRREERAPLIQRVKGTATPGGTTLHGERWSNKVSLTLSIHSEIPNHSEKFAEQNYFIRFSKLLRILRMSAW
jgi:hypothetical protein